MRLLFSAAVLCAALVPFVASAQLKTPSQTSIKPFRTLRVEGPVVVDTRRFMPQIAPNVPTPHEIPENPTLMLGSGPGEGNSLALGGMLDEGRGNLKSYFPGITSTGWHPADPTIAVGPSNIVETVNMSMAFFAKDGTLQLQQSAQTFFSGLGAGSFQFDPRVVYDRTVNRWIIMFAEQDSGTQTSKILLGVSQTSNPNGLWNTYRIEAKLTISGSSYWLDYPSLGYDVDGVMVCGNMFGFSSGFAGVQFIAVPKAPLMSGSPVTANYLRDAGTGSAQLADSFDSGVSNIYASCMLTTSSARIYAFSNTGGVPTMNFTSVTVPTFASPAGPATSTPGALDTIDARIFSATWRSGHLFTSHNVNVGGINQVRWYDFNLNNYPTGTPSLAQSGNVAPPGGSGQHFHMGATGSNGYNDISAIFTRSSSTIPADAMFAGRRSTDSAGSMGTPVLLETSAGNGYGGSGTNRWGDYFRCVVDPVDDATFWGVAMTGMANNDWRVDIYSWTVTPPANLSNNSLPPTVLSTQTASGTISLDSPAPQYGYTVALSSSNSTVASVPATVTVPGGSSTVNYTLTAGSVTTDTPVTITATLRGVSRTATITVLSPRIIGAVTLGDYTGPVAGQQVRVDVRMPGTTTVVDTYNATLDATGHFSVTTSRTGTYDIAIKGSHWLRKVVANVAFNGAGASVSATLINGDVNGDNTVSLDDFAALRTAFGSSSGSSNWNPNADLNGDGSVGLSDFGILRNHFGQSGDN